MRQCSVPAVHLAAAQNQHVTDASPAGVVAPWPAAALSYQDGTDLEVLAGVLADERGDATCCCGQLLLSAFEVSAAISVSFALGAVLRVHRVDTAGTDEHMIDITAGEPDAVHDVPALPCRRRHQANQRRSVAVDRSASAPSRSHRPPSVSRATDQTVATSAVHTTPPRNPRTNGHGMTGRTARLLSATAAPGSSSGHRCR